MKVDFTYKNGTTRTMNKRYANILTKLKRGTYVTSNMAEEAISTTALQAKVFDDGYDDMTIEELKEIAQNKGIDIHPRTGIKRIIAALRGE